MNETPQQTTPTPEQNKPDVSPEAVVDILRMIAASVEGIETSLHTIAAKMNR